MSTYRFDGSELRGCNGHTVAYVRGDELQDEHHATVGYLRGEQIQDRSHSIVGFVRCEEIEDARHSRLARLDDVRKLLAGPGGRTLAALWLLFVR